MQYTYGEGTAGEGLLGMGEGEGIAGDLRNGVCEYVCVYVCIQAPSCATWSALHTYYTDEALYKTLVALYQAQWAHNSTILTYGEGTAGEGEGTAGDL